MLRPVNFIPRIVAALVAVSLVATGAFAQIPAPSVISFGGGNPVITSGTSNATLINVAGAPGTGYTVFQYGSSNSNTSTLTIDSLTMSSIYTFNYRTRTTSSSTNSPPDNFDETQVQTFQVIRKNPNNTGTNSRIILLDSNNNNVNPTTGTGSPSDPNVIAANNVLNQAVKFGSSNFLVDVNGTPTVASTVGTFTFQFTDFVTGVGFTGIQAVFTPVPEPTSILAVAGLGMVGLRAVRRRLGKSADPVTA